MTSDMSRFEQQQQTVQSGQFVPKSEPVDEVIDQNQNNTTVVSAARAGDTQIYRMSEDGSKLMGALKGTGGQEGQMVVETSYQGGDQITAQSQPQNNAIAQAMAAAEQDTEAEAAGQQQLVIHADGQNEEQSQYVVATVTTTLHVCAVCGKAYTQKDGLEEHMQSHASRLHSCSLCGAIFIDKSHLDVHMRQTHYATGGGDTKMVVVEDDKTQLRAQTQLVQGANGQILQVQVPANNNNNTNTNNNMKPAGQQQVEVADGSEEQGTVVQQTGATAASTTTTDHSIHRCPLCPYMSTSVNEFCKHVVLHAESKSDTPEQPPTTEAPVTIQPAAAGTVVSASGDKPQISIVPAAGNGTQTVTAQQFIASNGQPQYRCGICGEMINDSAVLQDHLRSHQESTATRLFSCSVCGVVYANKNQLETHMQTHIIATPIPAQGAAPASTVAAAQVTQVATTQATVNGETRQVLIQTAGTTEWLKPTPSTTTTAVVGISGDAMSPSKPKERPYSCQSCGKTFCQKAHLENHLRIHTGERPFACSMCGKAFRRKEHIGRHMRIHTGERPFHCTHCGKRFSQKVHLESHIRIHTGERPFSCSACGKTFTRKEHIERHIKTHTGERMFVCSQCGKSFNQKAHLESHMRTHTGERPYTCGPCGKTFRQRVQLERHARTHLAPGTEGILTTTGGQQVLTVAAVPGQQLTFIADPNIIQQLQSADGHTTITVPFCTLCGKALCQHMDAQQRQLIENAAAQGAQVQVVQAAPGQQLVQETGQLQVVDAGVIANADGAGDAVAQAVAQATGIEHDVSVQGMSVQEQVDKAISNAVA